MSDMGDIRVTTKVSQAHTTSLLRAETSARTGPMTNMHIRKASNPFLYFFIFDPPLPDFKLR
jgi:hypothetical protein